ncbi:hypothetical protein GQ53DRAFT_121291 [Thozetella sp. PMI_491]|nr:hypothetical protein GQ53DRAFT_121291 [Thozetella sp. PMI_491]
MAPLDDELFDAFQQSAWDNGKKFLPADCFERLFTADALAVEFADSQWARIEAGIDDLKMLAAILLYIGELDTLPEFHETGFRDSYLPMKEVKEMTEAGSEQRVLESVRTGKRFGSLGNRARAVHAFLDAQWYFRAPVLCGMDLQTFDMECCLPFIENGGCFSKGSFGEVYAIKVHHAHLLLNPRPNEGDEPLLALKQLKPTAAKEGFDREYAALKRLQEAHHHHLIQAIASFTRGENCFF